MSDVCLTVVMSVCLFLGWIGLSAIAKVTTRYLLVEPVKRWMERRAQWRAAQDEVESYRGAP